MPIDYEYIRLLMLYSDEKFPFEKAKGDPGLGVSIGNVNRHMTKHGSSRKLDNAEAHQILLQEKHAAELFMLNKMRGSRSGRDRDDYDQRDSFIDFTPKAEQTLNEIENKMNTQSNLENEVAMLRKALQDKEAELRARSIEVPQSQPQPPINKAPAPPDNSGIIERKLEDTGYSDKINN